MKRKTGNKQQKAPSPFFIRQAGIQNLLFSLAKYNF